MMKLSRLRECVLIGIGFLGDLFASVIYVPSEVLKTRLQLQGRYNNPHFNSGYNYRGTIDAARTVRLVSCPLLVAANPFYR